MALLRRKQAQTFPHRLSAAKRNLDSAALLLVKKPGHARSILQVIEETTELLQSAGGEGDWGCPAAEAAALVEQVNASLQRVHQLVDAGLRCQQIKGPARPVQETTYDAEGREICTPADSGLTVHL